MLPPGADTIVIQENTTRDGDTVMVTNGSRPRAATSASPASISRPGAVLLAKGTRLTARDLALAAAMNHPTVPVHRVPKVAVLATGDELVMPGTEPGFGEIVYSNGYATMALARGEGCEVIDLGIVPDRLDDTIAAVRRARDAGADILVTSGGASVGDYDLVQKALAAEGLALSFWKVALRPGRPMMHGRLGAMHVLGLPGNPVSAYRLRGAVPGPADPPARRTRPTSSPRSNRPCSAATCPQNDERADYLRATLTHGTGRAGGDALPPAGQFHAGPARKSRLSAGARAACAGRPRRQPLQHPEAWPL